MVVCKGDEVQDKCVEWFCSRSRYCKLKMIQVNATRHKGIRHLPPVNLNTDGLVRLQIDKFGSSALQIWDEGHRMMGRQTLYLVVERWVTEPSSQPIENIVLELDVKASFSNLNNH